MAQYPTQRPVAMDPLTTHEALLVCRTTGHGQPSFILACDDRTLRRLAKSLRSSSRFMIRDGDRLIAVEPASRQPTASIKPVAAGSFRWCLQAADARHHADLLVAMANHRGPCHHYLAAGANLPPIRVSKGEYDAAALRTMQASAA